MNRRHILQAVVVALLLCPSFLFAYAGDSPCKVPERFSKERPDPEGVPTRVEIGLFINDITGISNKEQTFTADLGLLLRWKDSRLSGGSGGVSFVLCKLKPDQVWNPGVVFLNARDIKRTFGSIKVVPDGTVTYLQRFYGEFSVPFELRRFPFDTELLWIVAGSIDYDVREVKFVVDQDWTGRRDRFTTPDWEFQPATTEIELIKSPLDGVQRSRFRYEIAAHRHPDFYIWKLIVPLMLIVFMSWAVFWIDPKQIGPRISLSLISMLNIIAYNFAMSTFIPRIPYLTLADKYIMGCLIIVFLALVEGITSSALSTKDNDALAKRLDRISRWAFPAGFLLLIGFTFGT